MTTSVNVGPAHLADLLIGIDHARLAPSVHNTQPWIFHVTPAGIDLLADSSRHLAALDPSGREMTLSCGAALLHLRVAMGALGYPTSAQLLPDPARPDVLARVHLGPRGRSNHRDVELDAAARSRQTNRRSYHGAVPDAALAILQSAASQESAGLQDVVDEDDRVLVKVLQQQANGRQVSDAAYRIELHAWVDSMVRDDGVPLAATTDVLRETHDFAARDFALTAHGGLLAEPDSQHTTVLVLYTDDDTPRAWLEAGQALARIWLEGSRLGLVMQPLSQSTEEPGTRAALRHGLRLSGAWPQLLLRVGHAEPQPRTPRRPAGDVTVIDSTLRGSQDPERLGVHLRPAVAPHST